MDKIDYKYLRAWNKMMASGRDYCKRTLEDARSSNAPGDAIYQSMDGSWRKFSDITNPATRELIEEMVKNDSYDGQRSLCRLYTRRRTNDAC